MALPAAGNPDRAPAPALPDADRARLRRYLPADLFEILDEHPQAGAAGPADHLAAARATVATYLPRVLIGQLLDERLESPWLRWMDGSLLFADLSGSTALAERLSALGREGTERVTDFLNHIFDTMIAVVQAHSGDLVSFGGDALLIFFGDERHPETATLAALALQEALHGYERAVPGVGTFPMHLHVGVESGPVAFVSAGTAYARHYSVVGATVNGVAEAEGLAEPGEVVVGPGTRAWLGGRLAGEPRARGFALAAGLVGRAPAPPPPVRPLAPRPELSGSVAPLLDDLDRLSAYIPDVLLDRILADPQRPQIEAELRPVTVAFVQAAGLERIVAELPPERAAQAVQAYTVAAQEAVEQYGGVVNKLDVADEGVKLVAIFGAPTAYEDHTERAARAALALRDRLAGVNRQIAALMGGAPFDGLRQRVGLNVGTVFAGNVGSPVRKEYTVMGDAVNVAARVMSKAGWGEVWCSEGAARSVAARVVCEERGLIALKGKAQPLALCQIVAERETPVVVLSDDGPLIGRDDELRWLVGHLDSAMAGRGRAVRIVGEAGVGKSRLAAALLDAARARGMRIIPAACFSYTSGIPYAAWGEWLKALCAIASGEDDDTRARKLSERLDALGPGTREWLPLLGDLVRLDVPESRLTRGLDPQMRQSRRFELLEQLLLHAAGESPVLVLFEDLHWADPISLDLWRRVAQHLDGRQALLLGVHRGTPALPAGGDAAEVLELQELSADESSALAGLIAGDAGLPEALLRQLVARASGNPLFLAELLRAVLDRAPGDGGVSLDDLPESLNGLLLSRIDRLDEFSRSLLRVGSVIGQRIPFGVLQSIQPADQRTLVRQLARLDSEELTVLERVEPERVHTFRHALIQEVAYQSMLYARRRELHGRIGEYLERRYGDDLDDYYGLLAHHYRLSDRPEKAVEYLIRAGHAAKANYANEEAIQDFRWALDALGDESDPRAWAARDALAEVYEATGRYDEALAQHAAVIAAPGVAFDVARRARRKRGAVLEKQGQYAAALDELAAAMEMARSGAAGISPLALPRTYGDIALVRQRLGEYDLAIAACEAGLASLRQSERSRWDELIEADLHSILGGIYGMRGDYPQCQHHFERCLRAREAADDLAGVAASHSNLGYLWQLQGDYERALTHYPVAEEIAGKLGLPYIQIVVGTNAADALINLGRYGEAEERCRRALEVGQQIQAQHTTAQIYTTLGIVYYHQGRYAEALEVYGEAQRANAALGSVFEEANAIYNAARVLSALGRYGEAEAAARQVLERAESIQSQRLKVEGLIALAEAAAGAGQPARCEAAAAEAAELATALGSRSDGGIAYQLLGRAAAAGGLPFAEHFERSAELLGTINHRFELARTWAAYGMALERAGNLAAGRAYVLQARDAFGTIGAHGELARMAPPEPAT